MIRETASFLATENSAHPVEISGGEDVVHFFAYNNIMNLMCPVLVSIYRAI